MSAQSLGLKHPYSLLAANPVNANNQSKFIQWFNNYISSSNLNSNKQKLDFINGVLSNLLMIKTNIGKAGVGAGAASTRETKDLYNSNIDRLMTIVGREKNRIIKSRDQVPDPPDDLVILQLNTIQERLLQFQENQHNHGKFTQMASEAKALIAELQHIQETLPPSEHTTLFTISQLLKGLNAWHRYFITVESKTTPEVLAPMIEAPPEGLSRKIPGYRVSLAAARNPRTGRPKDLSLEERVAELRNLSAKARGRGTKKEPGEKYFAPGGKRKTHKHKRRRKRKTRKHRQKKRTRRRKPKKRNRRTRRR